MARLKLQIEGMTCSHCERAVETALKGLDGITQAEVDLQANTASVTYDEAKVTISEMKEAIKEEGYEVTKTS